jgi:hypothetical protein
VTAPLVLYSDPWHGQTNVPDWNRVTSHPSCVQIAVKALNVPCETCVTRNFPDVPCTNAALPTLFRGELPSIVRAMTPPDALALMVANDGALLPPLGDVGLLPPQPSMSDATETNVRA